MERPVRDVVLSGDTPLDTGVRRYDVSAMLLLSEAVSRTMSADFQGESARSAKQSSVIPAEAGIQVLRESALARRASTQGRYDISGVSSLSEIVSYTVGADPQRALTQTAKELFVIPAPCQGTG